MLRDKSSIIITFDDVIAYTSYDLYTFLNNHFNFFSKYLDIFPLRTMKDVYERNEKDLVKSLIKTEFFGHYPQFLQTTMYTNLYTVLAQQYYSVPKIYDEKIITPIAKNGILSPIFSNCQGIKNIIILIKYKNEVEKNNKIKLVEKLFNKNPKLKVFSLNYFKEDYNTFVSNMNWDLLITDDVELIEKTAAGNIDHKEYLLPLYGYNKPKPELLELIKQKSATLSYYELKP